MREKGCEGNAREKCAELNPSDMTLSVAYPDRPPRETPIGTCCVYFMWSRDWRLLYVGVTDSPVRRFAEHRRRKPWWHQVHHVEVEQYPSRRRALRRETEAIAGWRPLHNIARPRWIR